MSIGSSSVSAFSGSRTIRATAAALSLALVSSGCIRQRMIIRSEPPGAELLINEHRSGTTPYDRPFLWYGRYRVTLLKPGYDRLDDKPLIRCPWYLWVPLDLFAELLPVPVRDTRVLSYQLVPRQALSEPKPPGVAEPDRPREQEKPPAPSQSKAPSPKGAGH